METLKQTLTYTTVSPAMFEKVVEDTDNTYILDVRHPDEYAQGHIAGANNDDVLDDTFLTIADSKLPINKTIAVYCGTGKRSAMASERLAEVGYKVVNLDGGLTAWEAAGLPVTK